MKHLFIKRLSILPIAIIVALSSCRKSNNDDVIPEPSDPIVSGIYILNQGNFSASNSTLSFYNYDTKKLTEDLFSEVNKKPLGATANDIQKYGSKIYVVVNVSSKIEVIDAKTAKGLKTIDMKDGATARQPRYVVFNNGKGYVSSYDGTVGIIDTTSLTITKFINVGRNPEQLAISNGKLYVANSGGLDFGNPDNTVSIIDLATESEKKITVPVNPVSVAADEFGDVYVISNGNYDDVPPSLTIINSQTDVVKQTGAANVAYGSPIVISGEKGFWLTGDNKVQVTNVKTEAVEKENFVTDGTTFTAAYSLAFDPISGKIYVGDAKNFAVDGEVYVYSSEGKQIQTIKSGINPGRIMLTYKY
ncbi:MAG: YncE family protein [Sphingobacteriaceae bacterium]|nr:MAG: YncE family protein [Sphingobacteriaceae bacterium]